MKRGWLVFMAAGISLWLLAPGFTQEDMVAVDVSPFERPQRPPAVFHHDRHNETAGIEECAECHHVYEEGKKVAGESSEGQRCADCHGAAPDGRKPGLARAFHTNCKGCHLEQKKGPVMCGACHVRQPPGARPAAN
jgi:hypothetical protein